VSVAHIRKLRAEDAPAYRALRLRGLAEFPLAFAESHDEFAKRTDSTVADTLDDPAGLRHVFGALTEAGDLVGIVGVTREGFEKMRHKGHIWGMYVAPEQHGRGIAKRLLEAAITHARSIPGLEQLTLIVGKANAGARALYESVGFQAFGLEPRELKMGGRYYDSIHMWLELATPHNSNEASSPPRRRQ
jgi:ribosomal protein S18 acetylase RimI-like enzyme